MSFLYPWVAVSIVLFPVTLISETITLPELSVKENQEGRRAHYQIHPRQLNPIETSHLSNALAQQKGIASLLACGFCGSRRTTLLGHRAEQTSFFIDGLPLMSSIVSFWGLDLVPVGAIHHIDVYWNPSQAMDLPESLAGAVSLNTLPIDYSQNDINLGLNHRGEYEYTWLNREKKTDSLGWLWAGQIRQSPGWDSDDNKIWELPVQSLAHFWTKVQWDPSRNQQHSLRYSWYFGRTQGGHNGAMATGNPPPSLPTTSDFEGGDVRKRYLGSPQNIFDQTLLKRMELAYTGDIRWNQYLDSYWGIGTATHVQNSIFFHGHDYQFTDQLLTGFLKSKLKVDSSLDFIWGIDFKTEEFSSQSKVLYGQFHYPPDDFHHQQLGICTHFKKTFQNLGLTGDFSLRFTQLKTHWPHHARSVPATILIPRAVVTHQISPNLIHSVGAGIGYRPPLIMFESQHGTSHNGMEIALDSLETSYNFQYQLISQRANQLIELTWNRSILNNLSYGLDRADDMLPTLFQNAKENYTIDSLILDTTWNLAEVTDVTLTIEKHILPESYTLKTPIALTEERLMLRLNYQNQHWQYRAILSGVGPRKLSRYGRYRYYHNKIQSFDDPLDPNFGDPPVGIDPKLQESPLFFTLDLTVVTTFWPNLEWEFAVTNVFDVTQNSWGDPPLTWHIHGNHYHLDNSHLWGPLRGREFWSRLRYQF
ncbi:MAG: hypothetical protein NZ480_04725 [Bdellovibrionaceae bacterium]|nr:hypothetical protein [Pseudobdellovibrionaceae bacterium]MDW8190783.1 hypothetical protein [Pseudobdellovibrionaceae bacterium]